MGVSIWESGWVCCGGLDENKEKQNWVGETARVGLLWQRRVNDGFSGDRLSCAGKIKWCAGAPGQGLWVRMREKLCLSCLTTASRCSGGGDGREEERILVSLYYGDVSLQRGERSLAWLFVCCALKLLWLGDSSADLELSVQLPNSLSTKFADTFLNWTRKRKGTKQCRAERHHLVITVMWFSVNWKFRRGMLDV